MGDGYPTVPEERLAEGGWEERVRTESTVFRTPTARIVGRTVLYDDRALRDALETAGFGDLLAGRAESGGRRLVETGADGGYWRFFFATALSFRPPLAPGIGPASMLPTVVTEARRTFTGDLEARGFRDVERGRSQRVRTESGDRARLAKVTASYPLAVDTADHLEIEGWLGVWHGSGFRIAGGAYPVGGLDGLLAETPESERPATDPNDFRSALLDLVRAVE
ncbi:hypothetical protein [Haloarcula salinisoli]|uniref:Uncharacterized protein n=1 Tax=Haloarcula salinisoli TaxID=2487746 RepID=A0A8J8C6M2_9EURY|nr:hypothetical protein [Halomicroarcula salinisoli]MBX0286130.1 hypothetical protein [Halomicroarcula salinisoli]MBX0302382.1 hypothetical protein [Halomicroarcula salinisoli]